MIHSRLEACQILGISPDSDMATIKTAYKNLVKYYHPDAGATQDVARYELVVKAYAYLCEHPYVMPNQFYGNGAPAPAKRASSGKILGNTSPSYRKDSNYASFEKKYQKRKEEKAQDFEYRMEEYRKMQEIAEAERKKREEEYNRAMEIIRSIRMAEAIKTMIKSPLDPHKDS